MRQSFPGCGCVANQALPHHQGVGNQAPNPAPFLPANCGLLAMRLTMSRNANEHSDVAIIRVGHPLAVAAAVVVFFAIAVAHALVAVCA